MYEFNPTQKLSTRVTGSSAEEKLTVPSMDISRVLLGNFVPGKEKEL